MKIQTKFRTKFTADAVRYLEIKGTKVKLPQFSANSSRVMAYFEMKDKIGVRIVTKWQSEFNSDWHFYFKSTKDEEKYNAKYPDTAVALPAVKTTKARNATKRKRAAKSTKAKAVDA